MVLGHYTSMPLWHLSMGATCIVAVLLKKRHGIIRILAIFATPILAMLRNLALVLSYYAENQDLGI